MGSERGSRCLFREAAEGTGIEATKEEGGGARVITGVVILDIITATEAGSVFAENFRGEPPPCSVKARKKGFLYSPRGGSFGSAASSARV
jgi:hypothetical protein